MKTESRNARNVLKQLHTTPCCSIMSGSLVYIIGKNKLMYSKKGDIKISKFFTEDYNFPS